MTARSLPKLDSEQGDARRGRPRSRL